MPPGWESVAVAIISGVLGAHTFQYLRVRLGIGAKLELDERKRFQQRQAAFEREQDEEIATLRRRRDELEAHELALEREVLLISIELDATKRNVAGLTQTLTERDVEIERLRRLFRDQPPGERT